MVMKSEEENQTVRRRSQFLGSSSTFFSFLCLCCFLLLLFFSLLLFLFLSSSLGELTEVAPPVTKQGNNGQSLVDLSFSYVYLKGQFVRISLGNHQLLLLWLKLL